MSSLILAAIVVAGVMAPGPTFNNKAECIKDAQEVGYQAIKSQFENKDVKLYCLDIKDYPDLKTTEVSRLKPEDLVPEKN